MERQGKVKHQHYVPRMYLERFDSKSKELAVLDVNTRKVKPNQSVDSYAQSNFFYDFDRETLRDALKEMQLLSPHRALIQPNNDDEQLIERMLCQSEGATAEILRAISQDHTVLFQNDISNQLIIFLHDLAHRSLKFRNEMNNLYEQGKKWLCENGISPDNINGVPKDAEDAQAYALLGIRPLLETAAMLLTRYSWHFGTVYGKWELVVSDNPAQGIANGFNDICIPISGREAIIFRIRDTNAQLLSNDLPDSNNEIALSEESVMKYNVVQWSYADKFLFGDQKTLNLLGEFISIFIR